MARRSSRALGSASAPCRACSCLPASPDHPNLNGPRLSLAAGVLATIFSRMLLVRRICGVLIFLALVLGGPMMIVSAGMADGISAHDMDERMSGNCPACDADSSQMGACAQTMCAALSGILPTGNVPFFGAQLAFVAGPDQSLAGMSPLPDPKPPRIIVLG